MEFVAVIHIKCIFGCDAGMPVVPLAGLEPTHLASEASALSSELQGLATSYFKRPRARLDPFHPRVRKNPRLLSPVSHHSGR